MSESARERRKGLGKQGFTAMFALFTVTFAYIIMELVGPVPVRVGMQVTSMIAPTWYLASAGLPFGILMAEAIIDFREMSTLPQRLMPVLMLLVLGLLGSIRLGVGAPVSGHALVASYFIVHELSEKRLGRNWKLLVGCAVLIQTAVYKLFIWSDSITLLLGIGFAISAWGIERIIMVAWAMRISKRRAR